MRIRILITRPCTNFHSGAETDPTFQFELDTDPDPTTHFSPDLDPPMHQSDPLRLPPFHFDADSDPSFHFDADSDPDLAFHFDEDPDPALKMMRIRIQLPKNYADPCVSRSGSATLDGANTANESEGSDKQKKRIIGHPWYRYGIPHLNNSQTRST
jgi:hypothetical protein